MCMIKFSFLFFLLCITFIGSKAQTGCVRTALKTRIYTSLLSGSTYKSTPYTTSGANCQYALTANTCSVSGITGTALKGTVGVETCPIDFDIWEMIMICSGVGYFTIRKKQELK